MIIAAAIVALACVAASAFRVWLAASPTFLDPDEVRRLLGPEMDMSRLREVIAHEPRADWERDLLAALDAPEAHRAALVNEQLTELDWRVSKWSSVPAVCARIATGFAFLLGALVLRDALTEQAEVTEMVFRGVIGKAIGIAATGFAGTMFCVGAHGQARRLARERRRAADAMVEALEAKAKTRG